jgi:hypothetical protein
LTRHASRIFHKANDELISAVGESSTQLLCGENIVAIVTPQAEEENWERVA